MKHIQRVFLFFFLAFSISGQLQAQQQKLRVASVTVMGNKTASERIIQMSMGLVEGSEVTSTDIQNGIKKLYNLRMFSDINVFAADETKAGVHFVIQVAEYPRIHDVLFEGNKKYKSSKLLEEITLIRGQVFSPHLINKARLDLEKKYKEAGFYNVFIDVTAEPAPDIEDRINITFIIDEGQRVFIDEILFHTNEELFKPWRLRWQMKDTKKRDWYTFFRSAKFDPAKFTDDKNKLLQFYRDHGYRDARVLREEIDLDSLNRKMILNIYIDEGPCYAYRNVRVEGTQVYPQGFFLKNLELAGIRKGETYKEKYFEMAVDAKVRSLYMDTGYLYAQVTPEITPVGEDSLDVLIRVEENHKVKVRRIQFAGNTRTREYVIRREMKLMPGDVFNRERLIRSQREIFMLNYFADVIPDIVPVDNETIDLEVRVEEKSSDQANASIGYSEYDGLTGSVGIEINNLAGRGQRLSISYQKSAGTDYVSLGFTEPWLFGRPNTVGVSLYFSQREMTDRSYYYEPYDRRILGATGSFGRRFRWPDSYFRGSWGLTFAYKNYYNVRNPDYFIQYNPSGITELWGNSLTQVITRDSRDKPEFPTLGSKMVWNSQISGGIFGGKEEFVKTQVTFETFTSIVDKLVFYQNFDFGVVIPYGRYGVIPYDELFHLGGANAISYITPLRGYADGSIRPPMSSYESGNTLLKYSCELRFLLSPNPTLYLLAFAEAGRIWNDLKEIKIPEMARSIGVGARVYMPMMGMLGVDFGYGFDELYYYNSSGKVTYKSPGWETHFVFGMPL
ncbi:MAG: outer membrane protein assembly factor BamA [Candidatus Marinimicrobia bacterium]|jgi:outer membrane protein insertion porin family|nr:outer membrane protein assembly factor BamA [Candidatus Neomarinimicrobiota bacterium]MDX9777781.1 outer membrane protein assembly factor BamA [bacterium]